MTLASMPPVDEAAAEAAFAAMVAAGGATVELADGVFISAIVSDTHVTHLDGASAPPVPDPAPVPSSTEQAARAQVKQLQAEFDAMAGMLSDSERAQIKVLVDELPVQQDRLRKIVPKVGPLAG